MFLANTKSMFVSVVPDSVLETQRLETHLTVTLIILDYLAVASEATAMNEARFMVYQSLSAKKTLQGSKTETN